MQGFKVSVAEILGHPGEHRDVRVAAPLEGVAGALARLEDEPVAGELRLESVVEGILVTGSVSGDLALECARCLKDFDAPVGADVCELFVAPGDTAPEEDAYRVAGLEIDLEPMVRDAIVLALPLNPLCREDCAGLCAHCGRDLNAGACDCRDDDIDPRWAGLAAVRDRLEDVRGA